MESNRKKIGILGVGNLLLSDEGFGIHLLRHLEEQYHFPEDIRLLDGGTAGIYMSPFLEECDPVLVLDVIAMDDEPGSIHCFSRADTRTEDMGLRLSPHQLGLLEVVDICELRGAAPADIFFFTIVPESLATGIGLSPTLAEKVDDMARLVIDQLAKLGKTISRKSGHA